MNVSHSHLLGTFTLKTDWFDPTISTNPNIYTHNFWTLTNLNGAIEQEVATIDSALLGRSMQDFGRK